MQDNQILNVVDVQNSENTNQKSMSRKEVRLAEYKRRYPLRSSWAYKRLLPPKMYWGGQAVGFIQSFCVMGMTLGVLLGKPWHSFLIPISAVSALICFFTVGLGEEEGAVHDNWRGIIYKCISASLFGQLLMSNLLNHLIKGGM